MQEASKKERTESPLVEILRTSSSASSLAALDELDNQMKFYERVKKTFFLELDKTTTLAKSVDNLNFGSGESAGDTQSKSQLSPPPMGILLQKRHSTSYEQKFFSNMLGLGNTTMTSKEEEENANSQVIFTATSADDDDNDVENGKPIEPLQHRSSIAQQLLDLHDYTGEVVGGSPLTPDTVIAKPMTGNLSLSRSSSRSSSVSSVPTTSSRKSVSVDMVESMTNVSGTGVSRKQPSLDVMMMHGVSDPFSSNFTGNTTMSQHCLVPTIVVHETKTNSKDQVLKI